MFGRRVTTRAVLAEAVGTFLLVAAVVGSAIAAFDLSPDPGVALFANAALTGAALFALIGAFGHVSGAHFNPVVSVAEAARGTFAWRAVPAYVAAQVAGGTLGAIVANVMFERPAAAFSTTNRVTAAHVLAEVVATAGLVLVIHGVGSSRPGHVGAAVGAYIAAAYFFTSSTSFANPAVTVARVFTDTPSGIAPASAPAFIVAQVVGGGIALGLGRVLFGATAVAAAPLEPAPRG